MNTTIDNARTGFTATTSSGLRALSERYAAWSARRRQIARVTNELNTYTDRQLADLGLCRSDIPAVARGTFRRA